MSLAYLDTSFLLSILFNEPGARKLRNLLGGFERVFSADLLLAETFAAATRENIGLDTVETALETISLLFPDRRLKPELREVVPQGHLRGADLWHLANAMFLAAPARLEISFLSRDSAQRAMARRVGFPTP